MAPSVMLVVVVASGCGSASMSGDMEADPTTGSHSDGGTTSDVDPGADGYCEDHVRVLDGLDEVGVLGRSGGEVVDAIAGLYTGGVRWGSEAIADERASSASIPPA